MAKIVRLTESDLNRIVRKILSEQPEDKMDRSVGIEKTNMNALGYGSNQSSTQQYKSDVYGKPFTGHEVATILQIGTAFIPVIGPFISSGIGFLEAKSYWDEGDKKTATIVAILSSLPLLGSVVSKIPGIKQLGKNGMIKLAEKISGGKPLSTIESNVVKGISSEKDLIKSEFSNYSKKLNPSNLETVSGGFEKTIPQNILKIIQKNPVLKVTENLFNIIKKSLTDLQLSNGMVKRLSQVGNTTKMEYLGADISLENLAKLTNVQNGGTINIKNIMENAYKSVYELEDLIKRFPNNRDILWRAKSGVLRFISEMEAVLK